MPPRVSVVILTLNPGTEFPEILAAVRHQELEPEVVVIDSGSVDGTVDFLRTQPVRLIEVPKREFNHGLTRNLGIRESSGEFVALLTQDARPFDRAWLSHLVNCFEDPKVVGAYSCQLPRGDANPFIRHRLSNWVAAQQTPRIQEVEGLEALDALPPLERLQLVAFDNVSSCLRRGVALDMPFQRRPFGEDLEWGRRAVLAGHRLVFEPRSKVVHSHNRSMWYEFKRIYRDHQGLNQLLGVHTVPVWTDVIRNALGALPDLRTAVSSDGRLGWSQALYWRLKAWPFSFTQNLAQYLGARSVSRLAAGKAIDRLLDSLFGSGV